MPIGEGVLKSRHPHIKVGDHIESINGDLMVGLDHQLVALRLQAAPLGSRAPQNIFCPLAAI